MLINSEITQRAGKSGGVCRPWRRRVSRAAGLAERLAGPAGSCAGGQLPSVTFREPRGSKELSAEKLLDRTEPNPKPLKETACGFLSGVCWCRHSPSEGRLTVLLADGGEKGVLCIKEDKEGKSGARKLGSCLLGTRLVPTGALPRRPSALEAGAS